MAIDIENPGPHEQALVLAVRNLVPARMPMQSGVYYRLIEGALQQTVPATPGDAIVAFPFFLGTTTNVEELYAYAFDIQDDPSNALFAVYSDNNGRPGSPELQSGVVDMLAIWGGGPIALGLSGILPAGWHWFCHCCPNYVATPDFLSVVSYLPDTFAQTILPIQLQTGATSLTDLLGGIYRPTWVADLTFSGLTELPDPFPVGGAFNSAPPLAIIIKAT